MNQAFRHLALIALVGVLAAACVPRPATPVRDSVKSNVTARKAQARKLARQGKLIESLNQWKVLRTIVPGDPKVTQMVRETEREAKKRAEKHFETAEAEIAKRRFDSARAHYIRVLAYDPDHKLAKKRLLNFELVRNRRSRPRAKQAPHQ